LRGLPRRGVTRLLGGFDVGPVPAVADKKRQHAHAEDGDSERNRRKACSGMPMAHIGDPNNR